MIRLQQYAQGLVLGFTCTLATAQPLVVITEGQTAQQLPSGAYLHMVDFETGTATNGMLLSESQWNRNWISAPGSASFISTGTSGVFN